MKPNIVKAAAEVVPDPKILVNMISQRVRQLCLGHRPMVEFVPGLGHLDIALSEIAAGKLTFEMIVKQNEKDASPEVVEFPAVVAKKPKQPSREATARQGKKAA